MKKENRTKEVLPDNLHYVISKSSLRHHAVDIYTPPPDIANNSLKEPCATIHI